MSAAIALAFVLPDSSHADKPVHIGIRQRGDSTGRGVTRHRSMVGAITVAEVRRAPRLAVVSNLETLPSDSETPKRARGERRTRSGRDRGEVPQHARGERALRLGLDVVARHGLVIDRRHRL